MPPDELRRRVDGIRWFHRIDLGHGLVTPGVDDTPRKLATLALPDRLDGKSVLDIGAWDGFFSFEAERRGAARVLAVDSFCWSGAGWGTKAGFLLAREALGSRVEDLECEVHDLTPERVGVFDVVLFLGVLYHLRHPLLALEQVARLTRDLLVVETEVDLIDIRRPAAAFYPAAELNRDPTNWWAPNPPALLGMLRAAGFPTCRVARPPRSAPARLARACLQAVRQGKKPWIEWRRDRMVVHALK